MAVASRHQRTHFEFKSPTTPSPLHSTSFNLNLCITWLQLWLQVPMAAVIWPPFTGETQFWPVPFDAQALEASEEFLHHGTNLLWDYGGKKGLSIRSNAQVDMFRILVEHIAAGNLIAVRHDKVPRAMMKILKEASWELPRKWEKWGFLNRVRAAARITTPVNRHLQNMRRTALLPKERTYLSANLLLNGLVFKGPGSS